LIIILVAAFAAVITWVIGKPMIELANHPDKFRIWVDDKGFFGKIAFVFMIFFQVILALIPGEPLEIAAGYAFGSVEGIILTVIGTVLGSVTVFFLVRKFGIKLCEIFFSREKLLSLEFLKNKKKRDTLAFLVFFLPGTPKDLITYFLGITDVKLSYVIFLSGIARMPSIVTSAIGGDALGGKKYITAVIVFAATLAVSGIGVLIYKKIILKRKNSDN